MKNAILFFIILATLCCNTEIYSQTSPVDDFSKFSKQDIPLKGDDTDFDEGIARTPARQSAATAFFMEIVCMLILHVLSMMLKLLSLIKVLANTYILGIIINLI